MPKPWDGITEFLPDTLKTLVEPELEKVFNEYEEKLGKYEAYDEYVDKYQPEQLANAVSYTQALEADPQRVFKQLSEFLSERGVDPASILGLQQEAVKAAAEETANSSAPDAYAQALEKKYNDLNDNFEKFARYVIDRDKLSEAERQQQDLDQAIDALEEANKDKGFDRDYVLDRIAAGATPDQAVKAFHDLLGRFGATGQPKNDDTPVFLGSGSLPSNQRPITELSEDELLNLSVQFIESQKTNA